MRLSDDVWLDTFSERAHLEWVLSLLLTSFHWFSLLICIKNDNIIQDKGAENVYIYINSYN